MPLFFIPSARYTSTIIIPILDLCSKFIYLSFIYLSFSFKPFYILPVFFNIFSHISIYFSISPYFKVFLNVQLNHGFLFHFIYLNSILVFPSACPSFFSLFFKYCQKIICWSNLSILSISEFKQRVYLQLIQEHFVRFETYQMGEKTFLMPAFLDFDLLLRLFFHSL